MESKEAMPLPASTGSSTSSALYPDSSENVVLLDKTVGLNDDSGNNSKGMVSEDEDYESGTEEFEMALDKPVLDEAAGEGNSDASFVDASTKLEISGVTVNDCDDVEKGEKGVEGGEGVVGKDSEGGAAVDDIKEGNFGGPEGFDGEGEIIDSVEKVGVNNEEGVVKSGGEIVADSAGEVVVEGVETKGEESQDRKSGSLSIGHEVSEPEAREAIDMGDADGHSVVDTVQVDVAGLGVAVVGEMEGSGVIANKPEEKQGDDIGVVEAENPEVVTLGGVAVTPEGDSDVDTVQVDVSGSGVVVVDEMEKSEVVLNKPEEKEVVSPVDARLTSEGDSVVDTSQVDKVGPGVAVTGEMDENGGEKIEGLEVPLVSVGGATGSDDGVNEEFSIREVDVNNQSSQLAAESEGDVVKSKPLQPEYVVGDEKSDGGGGVDIVNGLRSTSADDKFLEEPALISEASENGVATMIHTNREAVHEDEIVASDRDINQLDITNTETVQTNGDHAGVHAQNDGLADGASEESKQAASDEPKASQPQEIGKQEDEIDEEIRSEDSMSDGDTDGMIFGSSEAAKKFIEDLERESGGDSHAGADSSLEQSRGIDGQIVTDSEEGDSDDERDGKEMFDSSALAALLKAATGADSDGGSITITSQDGRLFSVERPAGLGSSLRSLRPAPRTNRPSLFGSSTPAGGGESEDNLSEEDKKKLEKLQQIRVKFLRLVHRLGLSPEESVAAQVLYRLALLGGRQGTQTFSLDAAKRMALELEAGERDDLDFSINILVLGKSGVGKSATINSVFGEEKAPIDAFETGTGSVKVISGVVDGVKIRVIDTPGLRTSLMEQGFNHGILSSVKKFTKKSPADVILYVDRLDAQTRDLNDLPLLKTVTSDLGSSIWRSAIVTLTHAASAPPDGPSGTPLSYEVFISQRSHVIQQSIGHAMGDRIISSSLMSPVSLVENHHSCRKNREGQKILPNGQSWRPQLLLLCYSMKILAEASSISKPVDPFDHRKLFGFRARSPPLPYMLSSMLQSRAHPKLPSEQGGDGVDSDIDLDDLSDSDQEEEDEYDQLPPFKPLRKAHIARLTREQKKAYFEEYEYRVKLLQKKQWKEELRRMREIKKKGKDSASEYGLAEDEADLGAAAPVAVPLPDMALPASFDGDNPAYRYRFLEPTSQFLARPVLDTHGWDHDCGYDGVNLEHNLSIASRFPLSYTIQITKDKKDFTISLDSSVSAKHGDHASTMAGFDIQSMGKQLAYVIRAETKSKILKKNRAAGGISFTFLGENTVPGVKIEDRIELGKQYVLVGSAGAVRSQQDTAFGANFELQRREVDYPIGQVQSTLSMSIIKWRGDLALGFNGLAQFAIGRNSKVAVRAGINNKMSGQVTVRTSSSEQLSLALAAIIPTALSIYRKLWPGAAEKYPIY